MAQSVQRWLSRTGARGCSAGCLLVGGLSLRVLNCWEVGQRAKMGRNGARAGAWSHGDEQRTVSLVGFSPVEGPRGSA